MSVLNNILVGTMLSLVLGLVPAFAGDRYYNPATGEQVYTAQGDCTPGEDFGGQVCVCQKKHGQYINCAFRAVGVAPATPWRDCFFNPYVSYHQECLANGQGQASASYQNGYTQGYQRPGSPFWAAGRPAPGYSSTYYCSGRRGDTRCDRMPRLGF